MAHNTNSCENCVICLSEIDKNDCMHTLPCNHSFHKNCFKNYRENTVDPLCPLCRAPIPIGSLEEEMYDISRSNKIKQIKVFHKKNMNIVHVRIHYKYEKYEDIYTEYWRSNMIEDGHHSKVKTNTRLPKQLSKSTKRRKNYKIKK